MSWKGKNIVDQSARTDRDTYDIFHSIWSIFCLLCLIKRSKRISVREENPSSFKFFIKFKNICLEVKKHFIWYTHLRISQKKQKQQKKTLVKSYILNKSSDRELDIHASLAEYHANWVAKIRITCILLS